MILRLLPLIAVFLFHASVRGEEEVARIEAAKERIVRTLKDPESARFQSVREVHDSRGKVSVVGELNARNSYGGYVGFKPFLVNEDVACLVDDAETMRLYRLSGASGPEAELSERLEDEAEFSAMVSWTLLANVIVDAQTPDQAVEAAMKAVAARAKENGSELNPQLADALRQQFKDSLAETLKNKAQLKAIKANPSYQKAMFVPVVKAQTLAQLKAQMGLK